MLFKQFVHDFLWLPMVHRLGFELVTSGSSVQRSEHYSPTHSLEKKVP